MKKLLFLMAMILPSISFGQVLVSKFKLSRDEPFGAFPGRKALTTHFKNVSDKELKYFNIHYYVVNRVGDVISGVERGVTEEGKEFIKAKVVYSVGPFAVGKKQKLWASGVITSSMKDIVAVPHQLEIVYMGSNESIFINITKDNIKEFFPNNEWIEYNRWNSAM